MILTVSKDQFTIIGGENVELTENGVLTILSDYEIIHYDRDSLEILDANNNIMNSVLTKGKYKIVERRASDEQNRKEIAFELIEPVDESVIIEEGVNIQLLRLLTKIKEINLIKALINLDFKDAKTVIEYDKVYSSSKNKYFIPELQLYYIMKEQITLKVFKQIFTLRDRIYEKRTDADKNHIVFGLNNPVIWLDADIKIKRIACGALQYRKGLHIREFDLMIYNLNLLSKFKLTEDKIKYAELMRDYNLL